MNRRLQQILAVTLCALLALGACPSALAAQVPIPDETIPLTDKDAHSVLMLTKYVLRGAFGLDTEQNRATLSALLASLPEGTLAGAATALGMEGDVIGQSMRSIMSKAIEESTNKTMSPDNVEESQDRALSSTSSLAVNASTINLSANTSKRYNMGVPASEIQSINGIPATTRSNRDGMALLSGEQIITIGVISQVLDINRLLGAEDVIGVTSLASSGSEGITDIRIVDGALYGTPATDASEIARLKLNLLETDSDIQTTDTIQLEENTDTPTENDYNVAKIFPLAFNSLGKIEAVEISRNKYEASESKPIKGAALKITLDRMDPYAIKGALLDIVTADGETHRFMIKKVYDPDYVAPSQPSEQSQEPDTPDQPIVPDT